MGYTVALGIATVFTAIALLLVALSFSTDHWVELTVDRNTLKTKASAQPHIDKRIYFTRNRGLFRECFPGNETKFLDKMKDKVIDYQCLPVPYEIPSSNAAASRGDDYWTMIHLRRANFAFVVCSMLFLVIGSIAGAVGCYVVSPSVLRGTGIVVFIGAACEAIAMVFFHVQEYYEKQKVDIDPYYYSWNKKGSTHADLIANHRYNLGWSYMIGWVGMGLASIAAILFLYATFQIRSERRKEKPSHHDHQDTSRSHKNRSRAYDYMEQQHYPDGYGKQYPPRDYGGNPYPTGIPYSVGYNDYPTKAPDYSGVYPGGNAYPTYPDYAGYGGYRY